MDLEDKRKGRRDAEKRERGSVVLYFSVCACEREGKGREIKL